jgi:hypothetical protein
MDLLDMKGCIAIDGLSEEANTSFQREFAVDEHDPLMAMLEEEAMALWNSTDVQDRFADPEEFCEWYIAEAQAA